MISIEAIVRAERINQVLEALQSAGCRGFYYYNVTGQGLQQGDEVFVGRGGAMASNPSIMKTLVRTIVSEDMKDSVVEAIIKAARSPGDGEVGDGKIIITPVSDTIRVRTGESGEDAL